MPPCSVSSILPRSSLTGWKMPCHPDSKRHVPSYTTLVPRWRGMAHSCSACVSGMRWVLYVHGGALRVFARVVGLLERRDVVHGCPSLGEVMQWRDVCASFAQNSRGRRKSFEACLADAGAERRCPVPGSKEAVLAHYSTDVKDYGRRVSHTRGSLSAGDPRADAYVVSIPLCLCHPCFFWNV